MQEERIGGKKNIIQIWCSWSLIMRIVIGMVAGAILGVVIPRITMIGILGTIFVGALKGIAPILVFFLVTSAISRAGKGIGKRFTGLVILYILSTLFAALMAVAASYMFPISIKLADAAQQETPPPSGIGEVFNTLLTNVFTNPVAALSEANYLGLLFWAIILGVCLKKCAGDSTIVFFNDLADAIATAVRGIIQMAPFGVLGIVFTNVSENGLSIFKDYGYLVALLVGCMLFVAFVLNPVISWVYMRRNSYPLVLRCLRESGITAFFTRSSAANIPVNMRLCERLGLDKDFYSVSIPLGATINMDGAAITITIMTMATCHTMGIDVHPGAAVVLCIIAVLGACGASGVAGGSLLLIPMACSMFGISNDIAMQVVAVGFIIGVIQDSMETALNSSSDVILAATAEYRERAKRGVTVNFLGEWNKSRQH